MATRKYLVSLGLTAAIAASGWISPATAAERYAEAPMRIQTEGLTAEEHLLKQVELSRRLLGETPEAAVDKAIGLALTTDEAAALEQTPRWVSPMRVGLVKSLASAVTVAGLDRRGREEAGDAVHRTADGTLVWSAAVKATGAGALRLHIQDLSLPRNAELYVFSRGGQAHGPYTGKGPDGIGDFWATAIFGSEALVQIRIPGSVREAGLRGVSLRIAEAGLITQKFASSLRPTFEEEQSVNEKAFCGNADCVIDATCSNVAAANPAKLAVAKMEWIQGAFIFTCTGGLMNDTNPSQNNFFLTANHCFSKNTIARNVSFYWRFASATCNGSCPSNGGWPFVTTGATVSASATKGDFTLLHLNANPPAGSVFLGWTSAPVANTNGAQLYRISNPIFGPQVYSQHNVDTAAGTCTGWPRGQSIYSRDITGATDGGSSGSPVLNASSQIVGQLSGACGLDPNNVCAGGPGEANATVDGALAFYFAQVKPFINP